MLRNCSPWLASVLSLLVLGFVLYSLRWHSNSLAKASVRQVSSCYRTTSTDLPHQFRLRLILFSGFLISCTIKFYGQIFKMSKLLSLVWYTQLIQPHYSSKSPSVWRGSFRLLWYRGHVTVQCWHSLNCPHWRHFMRQSAGRLEE